MIFLSYHRPAHVILYVLLAAGILPLLSGCPSPKSKPVEFNMVVVLTGPLRDGEDVKLRSIMNPFEEANAKGGDGKNICFVPNEVKIVRIDCPAGQAAYQVPNYKNAEEKNGGEVTGWLKRFAFKENVAELWDKTIGKILFNNVLNCASGQQNVDYSHLDQFVNQDSFFYLVGANPERLKDFQGKQPKLVQDAKALWADIYKGCLQNAQQKKISVAAVYDCRPTGCSYQEINGFLTHGEFDKALTCCSNVISGSQRSNVCAELETPLAVEANFQYQKDGRKPSGVLSLDSPDLNDLTLTDKDNYRILFSVSQNGVYLYVFQKDHYGRIQMLFPDPVWSQGVDNPVQRGKTYQVPVGERDWLYLDQLPTAQIVPITESLYVVAAPWRALDLEQAYGEIHGTPNSQVRKQLVETFIKRLQARSAPSTKCLCYKEYSFEHGR